MTELKCLTELMLTMRECVIYHYWAFLNINFNFQPEVCNGCRILMQKSMGFNDAAIVTVKGDIHIIHLLYMSKDETIN